MSAQKYAIIKNNVVIASILWDAEQSPDYVFPQDHDLVMQHNTAAVGWQLTEIEGEEQLVDPDPIVLVDDILQLDDIYAPLEPWRFWAIIEMPGSVGEANLRATIDAHIDPVFKAIAKAKLNNPPGGSYTRSDALFTNEDLLTAVGIDEDTINSLWTQALALPE